MRSENFGSADCSLTELGRSMREQIFWEAVEDKAGL